MSSSAIAPQSAVMPSVAPAAAGVTEAQLAANRANAQLSRGPVTPEGKAKSSLNAVKTGLTGRTVLLPSDEVATYEAHLARHFQTLAPEGEAERTLVQQIADAEWRILRIPALEEAIWSHGNYSFSDLFPDVTDAYTRQHLIKVEIMRAYRKELSNLALQENRLNRLKQKHLSELSRLQELRRYNEKAQLEAAMKLHEQAKKEGKSFEPAEFGFEFSKAEFLHYLDLADRQFRATQSRPSLSKVLNAYRSSQKAA